MTNEHVAPEFKMGRGYIEGSIGGVAYHEGWLDAIAALVEAQQPATCGNTPYDEGPFTLAQQPAPSGAAAEQKAGVTKWHLHLVRVIADKIEDGTLFQSGIYSNKDLARFVRNVADAATAPQPSPTPKADSAQDEFISREEWVERAMRVYLIAGDTEDEARECAEYQWGELDMDDIPDPYFTAMEDIEGRGPAPQADSAPHPIDPAIAADLERSDWTPEEALRWYAAGKHYDTVPNGDGSSSARILDNGAVASNALKSMSREYAEHKGDVALSAPQADSQPVVDSAAGRYRDECTQGGRCLGGCLNSEPCYLKVRAQTCSVPTPTHAQIAAYLEATGAYVTNDSTLEDSARLWNEFIEAWRKEVGVDKIVNIWAAPTS